MTNPLAETLTRITAQEQQRMTDEDAQDRREGYADGMAFRHQAGRSLAYRDGWLDGGNDVIGIEHAAAYFRKPRPLSVWWRAYAPIARVWL